MTMHSLDFEEFLWARGISEEATGRIRECISGRVPLGDAVESRMSSLFREYMIVGGMPRAVQTLLDTRSYAAAGEVIGTLIDQAKADANRYNSVKEAACVSDTMDSIPAHLAGSNKKFMYTRIGSAEGSRKSAEVYSPGVRWLVDAGYANPCYRITSTDPPIPAREDRRSFKMYMSDTGILTHMYGEATMRAILEDDLSYNMGAVAENAVAECITKCGLRSRYYVNNKGSGRMEIDFVVELGKEIAAVEVKSGRSREYPSLGKLPSFHHVDRRILLGRGDIGVTDDGVETYPLFAAAFMDFMADSWDGSDAVF